MALTLTVITFLATVAIVGALIYAFSPGNLGIADRVSQLLQATAPVKKKEVRFAEKQKEIAQSTLASVGKLLSPEQPQGAQVPLLMLRAGFRTNNSVNALRGVKVLLPIGLIALVFVTGLYRETFFLFPLAALVGFPLPEAWLVWRVHARQRRLQLSLPDGLDLLVICVEAGLGLDQALMRVAQELRISHSDLSDELQLFNTEMRIGKTRAEALRELARRTGLEDLKALAAMLIQTERFGTSIAESLRVHSDDLRTKRRQRAEEMSAKTTVKMVPPLVFFIFPALMVVILGPAALTLMRTLMPTLK
jgi:tight adherence protein C